ncbi:MAG: YceH family protein [Gammaproteobacteria bacterium]
MIPQLTEVEARIIGCLMEKQVTTPDHYPLSLNALTAACNQKSSREPVMQLSQSEVENALSELIRRHLVTDRTGFGSRVVKYGHRFCNTQFSQLHLSQAEYAVICELLLRGPQTPGELRSRANRMHPFKEVTETEQVLSELARRDEPLVERMPREPGRQALRWRQLFTDAPETEPEATAAGPQTQPRQPAALPADALADRVADLEEAIRGLERRIDALEAGPAPGEDS